MTVESLFLGKNKIEKLQVLLEHWLKCNQVLFTSTLYLGSGKTDKPESAECSSELLKIIYQIWA